MKMPFRSVRRRLRQWKAVARLQQECRSYARRFALGGFKIPDDDSIRALFRDRRARGLQLSDGPLHVLAVYHDAGWEEASLGGTLRGMGDVVHIDPLDPAYNLGYPPCTSAHDQALLKTVLPVIARAHAVQPLDAVFMYMSGRFVTPKLLTEIRQFGAPIVNLALNDKESFVGRVYRGRALGARDICPYFDLCWTSTRDALPKYVVEGATPVYLPEGGNPNVHARVAVDRDVDVSFVGQCYEPRPSIIGQIRRAGINVQAFGPGWPAGRISLAEMVRVWCRSRVALGFSGVAGHPGAHCLKGRDFELPMSGGLYLTEHHEEIEPFYRVGEEILTWRHADDLIDKVRWVISHPVEADRIREAGRRRAIKDHTWEARFRHVFDLMGVRGFTREPRQPVSV